MWNGEYFYRVYYEYFLIELIIKELYEQFQLTFHILHTKLNAGNSLDYRDETIWTEQLCSVSILRNCQKVFPIKPSNEYFLKTLK